MRDYVHVTDLADAHIASIKRLLEVSKTKVYNVGAGRGYSVNELINTLNEVTGKTVSCIEGPGREGDPPILVSSIEKIKNELGWVPLRSDLKNILKTAWKWHKNHPEGYKIYQDLN